MKQLIKKIWLDTLTSPDGKYSRKSLTMCVSFVVTILLALCSVIYSMKVEEFIFFGFLGMAGGQSVLTLIEKIKKPNP